MPIPRKFYERDTVIVAKELVGKKIIRVDNKTTFSGIIPNQFNYYEYIRYKRLFSRFVELGFICK